jgi:hypothetical protein
VSYSLGNNEVLLIDFMSEGTMRAMFERTHTHVVVVSPKGAEIRQYEALSVDHGKYAVHTVRVPAPSGETIDYMNFCKVFKRQWEVDKLDIIKAVKMAIKGSNSQNSVV